MKCWWGITTFCLLLPALALANVKTGNHRPVTLPEKLTDDQQRQPGYGGISQNNRPLPVYSPPDRSQLTKPYPPPGGDSNQRVDPYRPQNGGGSGSTYPRTDPHRPGAGQRNEPFPGQQSQQTGQGFYRPENRRPTPSTPTRRPYQLTGNSGYNNRRPEPNTGVIYRPTRPPPYGENNFPSQQTSGQYVKG